MIDHNTASSSTYRIRKDASLRPNSNEGNSSSRRRRCRFRWFVFTLLACLMFWFGFVWGIFACHHRGFDLTAHRSHAGAPSSLAGYDANSLDAGITVRAERSLPPVVLLKPEELKLPTPIIVMGLMKAGTTSIHGYFKCGLRPDHSTLSHYNCNDGINRAGVMSCGKRMRRNITKMNRTAFDSMDSFTVYAELDAQEKNGGMTLPQWQFIGEIHESFPRATWVLNLRNPHDWLASVSRWQDLRQRFIDNAFNPDLPRGKGGEDRDLVAFYLKQAQRIRNFVAEHPSHALVEVPIDKPEAGQIMEAAFGISAEACWRKRNANNGTSVWVEH